MKLQLSQLTLAQNQQKLINQDYLSRKKKSLQSLSSSIKNKFTPYKYDDLLTLRDAGSELISQISPQSARQTDDISTSSPSSSNVSANTNTSAKAPVIAAKLADNDTDKIKNVFKELRKTETDFINNMRAFSNACDYVIANDKTLPEPAKAKLAKLAEPFKALADNKFLNLISTSKNDNETLDALIKALNTISVQNSFINADTAFYSQEMNNFLNKIKFINPALSNTMIAQYSAHHGGSFAESFNSILILPVQRTTKYNNFLEQLINTKQ